MSYPEIERKADKVMVEVAELQLQKNFAEAVMRINEFLSSQLPPKVQEDFYAMKSSILESMGKYSEAKENINKALSLSERGSYSRYVNYICLGSI